ncbi:hypothetical protein, partial [Salmonella enterica]|uniref:hypothetical protein n=1 Tax=Salmonella enterica TaxID=28901 RepID=UPI00344E2A32
AMMRAITRRSGSFWRVNSAFSFSGPQSKVGLISRYDLPSVIGLFCQPGASTHLILRDVFQKAPNLLVVKLGSPYR